MPLRVPSCCRAVRRPVSSTATSPSSSDAYWISDETLSTVFNEFANKSKVTRRYGSSVPGPLESRRRLGRRRMTACAEPPAAAFFPDLGALLWGKSSKADDDLKQWEWQWQAPRPPREQVVPHIDPPPPAPALPSTSQILDDSQDVSEVGITSMATEHGILTNTSRTTTTTKKGWSAHKSNTRAWYHLGRPLDDAHFRPAYHAAASDFAKSIGKVQCGEISSKCHLFKITLESNVQLGRLTKNQLVYVIQHSDGSFPKTASLTVVMRNCISETILQAVWNGLRRHSIETGDSVDPIITTELISAAAKILAKLDQQAPSTHMSESSPTALCIAHVQQLMGEFIRAAPSASVVLKHKFVLRLFGAWLNKWLVDQKRPADSVPTSSTARQDTLQLMADSLSRLSLPVRINLIDAFPDYILAMSEPSGAYRYNRHTRLETRLAWMTILGISSAVSESSLLRRWSAIWKQDHTEDKCDIKERMVDNTVSAGLCPTQRQVCEFLLRYWSAQRIEVDGQTLLSRFRSHLSESKTHEPPISWLLKTLYCSTHIHTFEERATLTFAFFRPLQSHGSRRTIIQHLARLRYPIVPEAVLQHEMQLLLHESPRQFLNLLKDVRLADPSWGTHYALEMIDNPAFSPEDIWAALHISPRFPNRRLIAADPQLLVKMAMAFAQSERFSRRVVLRNLHRVANHLTAGDVMLSRTLASVGITNGLYNGQWPGNTKVAWVLRIIEKSQGKNVAKEFGKIVWEWRERQLATAAAERREGNLLRLGPID